MGKICSPKTFAESQQLKKKGILWRRECLSLLSELCVCGKEALIKYLDATTKKDLTPGIIAVIQSFGSRINFHPHLHFLVTEGGTDKKGQFHRVTQFNDLLLCRFFTLEVFSLLLRKQLINQNLV
ncbi:MAG: transposase [Candidatus Aminicenantaceae bacterium]